MNPLQMALQIRAELRAVTWPAGGSKIFNDRNVFVFAGTPTEEQIPPVFPWCMVNIGDGRADPDHPELLEQDYTIITAAQVHGDPLGEFAITGGARADTTTSAGAGLGEIGARVRVAVQDLVGVDGAKIILSSSSLGTAATLGRGRHIAVDELGLTAVCVAQLAYASPQELVDTSDTWTWEGVHCSDRFDFVQYRFGYSTGSTPPVTPASATAILYTGTAATTIHEAVNGRAYAVWADYNTGRGESTVANSSRGDEVGAFVLT